MSKQHNIDENQLSLALIEAQYQLLKNPDLKHNKSVVILISGIELAGKGKAVKQLREWLDPRYLRVKTLDARIVNENEPIWLRYTPLFPAIGQVSVLFGAWYSDLFLTMMHEESRLSKKAFQYYLKQIEQFEQDLANNHIQVVKIWFDLSWKTLQKRLDELEEQQLAFEPLHGIDWRNKKQYDELQQLRKYLTTGWYHIDGEDYQQGQYQFAQHILHCLQQQYQSHVTLHYKKQNITPALTAIQTAELDKKTYKRYLKQFTRTVAQLLRQQRKIILVFEGMDASGKGGAIKRIIKHLDPREYDIHSISAPEPYELRRPYLWRFWTKLAQGRNIQIFDRSWYGRVLVERIEGFANDEEWQRAYDEINRFEQQLIDNNVVVLKFWLATSQEEQLHRFEQREQIPHKRFKITAEDWRNRAKWQDYLQACSDMLHYTQDSAKWHIIATDDKYTARLQVLKSIIDELEQTD